MPAEALSRGVLAAEDETPQQATTDKLLAVALNAEEQAGAIISSGTCTERPQGP